MKRENAIALGIQAGLIRGEILIDSIGGLENFASLIDASARAEEREAMVAEAAQQNWAMKNEDPFEDCVVQTKQARTTMKHPRAELISKWLEDTSQPIWSYFDDEWVDAADEDLISIDDTCPYAIGPKPTEPPQKMCTLAGVSFPVPYQYDEGSMNWMVISIGAGTSKTHYFKYNTDARACFNAVNAALKQAIKEAK